MYKGYEIDGSIFKTKEDVDNFLRQQAVNAYKIACQLFDECHTVVNALHCDEKAEILVNNFGYTWDEVEALV